ncbi:SDR family NAD(P)-dependent oxidoreductase [Frankia gtarii]|uniref:SDR family NAD(P)-dependent oxidoreductase n=1 Tax=Frankia gtarii TaxID=2950102 RepID=UPI0021BFA515|nr:SDR family oxidoreductase [Frankia gtarii]
MTAPSGTHEPARRFDGRVAFITGGAAGFGLAFAQELAERGASVVLADIDAAAAERSAAALAAAGHAVLPVRCDVAAEDTVDAAVAQAVERFGGIDILINNAGRHLTRYNLPFQTLARDDVRELFDVNVMGVVNCSLACRPSMAARGGGSIVNISSMASHIGTSPYAVSKLAVRGLTVAFATEFAPDGIRVNAISPGLMDTESAMADLPVELIRDIIDQRQLIHRQGRVADVVAAMTYLCSAEGGFVTGETIKVTGGFPLYS